ncbi:histidine phosphatase family protein [Actinomadura verrucosospora]|uniref:Phosphoglycerate mutase n=1 Tax=Actinomadura verrucosospora TaxID=46165 RepID=A0A7D3VQV0_ACTVE|nr:histidine phosphatase family protein [Actinomadura verrucosospora]QKG19959.1 phosphoglycerate mutase [Actinomadura verrucosospora]
MTAEGGARKIVLVRHGRTVWNDEGRFQGATDMPLDAVGIAQAARAAELVAALRPTAIVSSPLQRAADTAQAIAEVTGLTVTRDPDLIERNGGAWEGLTAHEIRTRYPSEHAIWQPPGGETCEEVAARFSAALDRALERIPDGGLLVVVSHGAAIRIGMLHWLGFPEELWNRRADRSAAWNLPRVAWRSSRRPGWLRLGRAVLSRSVGLSNGSWSVLEEGPKGWRLIEHNVTPDPAPVLSNARPSTASSPLNPPR